LADQWERLALKWESNKWVDQSVEMWVLRKAEQLGLTMADQSVGPLAGQWERLALKWESQWVDQSVEMWVLRKAEQLGLTMADQSVGPLADQWERLALKWESKWVDQSVEMWVLRKAEQLGLTMADQSVGPLAGQWERLFHGVFNCDKVFFAQCRGLGILDVKPKAPPAANYFYLFTRMCIAVDDTIESV
jgi:hypothetical protein